MRPAMIHCAVHMPDDELSFSQKYIRENLTLDEILRIPGVERLVINAKWEQIMEAHTYNQPRNNDELHRNQST